MAGQHFCRRLLRTNPNPSQRFFLEALYVDTLCFDTQEESPAGVVEFSFGLWLSTKDLFSFTSVYPDKEYISNRVSQSKHR